MRSNLWPWEGHSRKRSLCRRPNSHFELALQIHVSRTKSHINLKFGTAYPLLVDIAFIQIHTHMTIYTNVKFPRTCGQLNGRTRASSPPVWPPSQRVTDGKNNIHTLWKICTRHNTLTNVNFFKYLSRCVLTSYKYVQLAHFAQIDLPHGHSSCCVAAQVETLLAGGWGWTWSRFLRQPKKAWPYSVL